MKPLAVKRGSPWGDGDVYLTCDDNINPEEWNVHTELLKDPENLLDQPVYQLAMKQLTYAANSVVYGKQEAALKRDGINFTLKPIRLDEMPGGFPLAEYDPTNPRRKLALFSLFVGH